MKLESADPGAPLLFDMEEPGGRAVAVVRERKQFVDADESVDGAISQARRSAELLLGAVRDLDIAEAELSFGLKLVGEVGLFAISRVGGETHCTVTLRWSRRSDPSPPAAGP